jgi:hypothetical protein
MCLDIYEKIGYVYMSGTVMKLKSEGIWLSLVWNDMGDFLRFWEY